MGAALFGWMHTDPVVLIILYSAPHSEEASCCALDCSSCLVLRLDAQSGMSTTSSHTCCIVRLIGHLQWRCQCDELSLVLHGWLEAG